MRSQGRIRWRYPLGLSPVAMRWRHKGLIGFFTALVMALMLISVGGAQEQLPDKGAPTLPEEPQAPACTLRRSGSISQQDEWLSCINVTASLSNAPVVGETATLSFTVTTDETYGDAEISVELPSNFEFVGLPAEMQAATAPSSEGGYPVSRAAVRRALPEKQTQYYQFEVRAIAPGAGQIRVRATGPAAGRVDAGDDDIFVTVGETPENSKFAIDVSPVGAAMPISDVPTPLPLTGSPKSASVEGMTQSLSVEVAAPGIACVVGGWFYVDTAGPTRPSRNFQVQAWDREPFPFGDRFLANGVTDGNGRYRVCFNNSRPFPLGGGVNIFVLFISENSNWRVRRTGTNDNFVFRADGPNNIPDGDFNFGNLQPTDGTLMRGLQAFDAVNDAFNFAPGACWGSLGPCRQKVINWAPNSVDGTFYSLGSRDVHLRADDPRSRILVDHELGHAIMDDVYQFAFPPAPNCNPHSIPAASSTGCAWTEGWAEWFPATVYNRPVFEFANGSIQDLEFPTWGTGGWNNSDTVEGRVAGALIDISDSNNEPFWDRFTEFPGGPGNIWRTFQLHVSNNFAQFWAQRGADGFNVAPTGALASVYQNTIDYNFRDPLGNYVGLTRPIPTPHNYSYNATTFFWSAVAIRPPPGADYDLQLFSDFNQTVLLNSSTFGGNTIDFVAVNSNIRPLAAYFPRVFQFVGTGNYQIELAQGADTLPDGSQTVFMGAGDVVVVRDTFLNAGVPYRFRVVPSNGGQDPELFLMGPGGNNVRARVDAVAGSSSGGPGVAEQFVFTPAASAWYGIVVLNKAGSGNYTLSREIFNYSLANSGNITVIQGASGSNTITATLVSGATQAVNLAVTSGLPAGATASFSPLPASCNPTCSKMLTIATTGATPTGTFLITVTGTSPPTGPTRTTMFNLVVNAPFNYSLANSGDIAVIQGSSGSNTITATLTSGATQAVSFAASGLPAGATATFSLASCSPTCMSMLTIATMGTTPTGTFPITVTGSPLARTTMFNLVVNAPPVFDYSLANSGDITVIQGSSGSNMITATLVSGATQPVSFDASGLPPGATAMFSPGSCNPDCSSTLTIATTGATPTGTVPITVTGSPLGRTTMFNLVVNPQQFTLTVNLAGTGSGTVSGPGINCPGVCSASFSSGTVANLAGTPDAGSFLARWDVCSGTSDCAVTMNADVTVTTTFDLTLVFFSPPTNFPVGTAPSSVAVGDFNGDGFQDLAVANQGTNDVTVLLGDGLGGFTAALGSPIAVGTGPVSVAVGDFNGDGNLDLAVANQGSDNVSILLGDGTGSFGPVTNFAVGTQPSSVVVGDFNGDANLDLAVANFGSNTVYVLLGDGLGGFIAGANFPVGTNPRSVAVGDFNGDLIPDLAVANQGSNDVSVVLGP